MKNILLAILLLAAVSALGQERTAMDALPGQRLQGPAPALGPETEVARRPRPASSHRPETGVAYRPRLRVEVSTGWQRESLRWSIAGNSAGQAPNIYSELKWRGVGGIQTGAAFSWDISCRLVLFAEGGRQFTMSGRVTDTDYGGNNRTNPIYGQTFDGGRGNVYAATIALGYRLWTAGRFQLTPFAGYGVSGQFLTIGGYAFLNSHYRTQWWGALIGATGEFQAFKRWTLQFRSTYHQVSYRADADWNLISSFSHPVSFRHRAEGYGLDEQLGLSYAAGRRIRLIVKGNYFNWRTGKGTDELYLSSGQTSQTQLNKVVMEGFGVKAGVEVGW